MVFCPSTQRNDPNNNNNKRQCSTLFKHDRLKDNFKPVEQSFSPLFPEFHVNLGINIG